jgi:hypothetical protein
VDLKIYDLADTSIVDSFMNVPTTAVDPFWSEYTIAGGLVPPDHFLIAVVQQDTSTNADAIRVDIDTVAPYSPYWGHDWSRPPGGTWGAPGYYGNFMIRAAWTCGPEITTGTFVRGDCDTIAGIFMSDAIYLLKALYVPGAAAPPSWDAADVNDDCGQPPAYSDKPTMGDAIYLLKWLYVPNEPPPPPPTPSEKSDPSIYPGDCGVDPTPEDTLDTDSSFCPGMGMDAKASVREWEIEGNMLLGDAAIESRQVTIPVYLENENPLFGFAYTISYDPAVLTFKGAETEGEFDFFSANPDGEGKVTVGAVVDFEMEKGLASGHHEVAQLVFEYTTERVQETSVDFTHVELVDLEAAPNGARTRGCSIGFGHRRPTVFAMHSSYPNPAREWTTIRYQLPKSIHTTLTVYNLAGQAVKTLVDGVEAPGYHMATWDRTDESGSRVSSGVYFYQLKTDEYSSTRKLVLVE